MYKRLFKPTFPLILGAMILPINGIAAEQKTAIEFMNEKLQEINKLQRELTRQLDESRARQIEMEQQRQLEMQNAQLSGQVQALQQQAKLSAQVQELQQWVDEFKSEQGVIEMRAVNTRPLSDRSKCEANPDNERGELNGRINFTKKFSTAPTVHAALKQIDMIGSTNRLVFQILSVDAQGFNYKFYTWCDTAIYSATASWIAVTP